MADARHGVSPHDVFKAIVNALTIREPREQMRSERDAFMEKIPSAAGTHDRRAD